LTLPIVSDLLVATISLVIGITCLYEIATSEFDLSILLLAVLSFVLVVVFGTRLVRTVKKIRAAGER